MTSAKKMQIVIIYLSRIIKNWKGLKLSASAVQFND